MIAQEKVKKEKQSKRGKKKKEKISQFYVKFSNIISIYKNIIIYTHTCIKLKNWKLKLLKNKIVVKKKKRKGKKKSSWV